MSKIKKPTVLIIFIAICLGAGGVGSVFTISAIPTWYAALVKPSFSPPNWIFGPVWTALYILMGISAYLIAQNKGSLKLFWFQLGVNFLWSYLFFGLRNPLYGFIWIILLWSLIAIVIYKFSKLNKIAAWLLYPYLAWVSFAAFLNYEILILNIH